MGCGASTSQAARAASATDVDSDTAICDNGELVHCSRESYQAIPLLEMYEKIEDALIDDVQEKRKNRQEATRRLKAARGAAGLQALGSLMSVLSTSEEVFADYLADCPQFVDLPTFSFNQMNAIPGSYMLYRAAELQEVMEGRGGQQQPVAPNTTLLGAALTDVLHFKAMWGRRLLGVTLMVIEHPALGVVALVQPLLAAAAMQRVFNWGDKADPVFEVLLQAGASANGRNSLNMTCLMLVATSFIGRLEYLGGSFSISETAATASATARMLLAAGADPAAEMRGFGGDWDPESEAARLLPACLRVAKAVLQRERYTAHEAFDIMRREVKPEDIEKAGPETVRLLDEFAKLLMPQSASASASPTQPPGNVQEGAGAGPATRAAGDAQPGEQQAGGEEEVVGGGPDLRQKQLQWRRAQAEIRAGARDVTWPWTQAMSNIAWAVSQVTMLRTAGDRRDCLRELCVEAPFSLPPMSVVSVAQLQKEGCIPRYSARGVAEHVAGAEAGGPTQGPAFRPLPVDELPEGSVVVFVSHRWLGRGCPDDDQGNKLKQVLLVADQISARRGVPLELVHLWLDYSVVDQDNPMPGVQALPIYIACCEEFVYIEHEEYWQRAWCLTEQFMAWKLSTSDVKHALWPWSQEFTLESARTRPPDPTYGKLAVEADRVALATMTSILRYD